MTSNAVTGASSAIHWNETGTDETTTVHFSSASTTVDKLTTRTSSASSTILRRTSWTSPSAAEFNLTVTSSVESTTPTSAPSQFTTSSSGDKKGAVAGIVVGSIFFVAVVVVAVIFAYRARRHRHAPPPLPHVSQIDRYGPESRTTTLTRTTSTENGDGERQSRHLTDAVTSDCHFTRTQNINPLAVGLTSSLSGGGGAETLPGSSDDRVLSRQPSADSAGDLRTSIAYGSCLSILPPGMASPTDTEGYYVNYSVPRHSN